MQWEEALIDWPNSSAVQEASVKTYGQIVFPGLPEKHRYGPQGWRFTYRIEATGIHLAENDLLKIFQPTIASQLVKKDIDPGRPKGTGRQITDAPLIEKMRELITGGQVGSVSQAARIVVSRTPGDHGASQDASITRLRKGYKAKYKE
jgi:hypothetical protein